MWTLVVGLNEGEVYVNFKIGNMNQWTNMQF